MMKRMRIVMEYDYDSSLVSFWEKGEWVWYPSNEVTNRYYGPAMRIRNVYIWYIHGTRIK